MSAVAEEIDEEVGATNESTEEKTKGATVFSFADKVAEKKEAYERRLYAGILSRVEHLQF